MIDTVLNFVSCSRASGLRISTAEVLDCLQHLDYIDLSDEQLFRAVLRANFSKSKREQARFDHLYHLFFHELRSPDSIPHAGKLEKMTDKVLDSVAKTLTGDEVLPALIDFLRGDPLRYLQEIRSLQTMKGQDSPGILTDFSPLVRRLEIMSQINAVSASVERFLAKNRSSFPWEDRLALKTDFNEKLQVAGRMLREERAEFAEIFDGGLSYDQYLGELGEKTFFSLTNSEVEEMRDVIAHLVRRLKDKAQRRFAAKSRGVLDIKKTLRLAAKYQGLPLQLVFKDKPKRKAKIVTLCDVSGSVSAAAKFMLNMLYALQDCFLQVRSFIFVAELAEVTRIFETFEINKAVDKALKDPAIDYMASTNYGKMLRQFKKQHLDILDKKTTLIIIGDGRTNYANPEEEIFAEIKDKTRRIIWLNPESSKTWQMGDSRMKTYQPYCDEVHHCQNLHQLLDFIKSLVL